MWYLSPAWSKATLLEHQFNLQYFPALEELPAGYFESEADNVPPPPLLHLCSTQARLWGISAEDRNRVPYTKEIIAGRAPVFGEGFHVQIPDEGGNEEAGEGGCTAIGAIDDKVIVFKRSRIYQLFGNPGDAAGAGSSLQTPTLISGDVGCVSATSVVEGPFGIAFLSERGFMVLGRDLSLSFIGEPVQRETAGGQTCVAGTVVPAASEVRWLMSSSGDSEPTALVWSYQRNAWSRYTSFAGRHACVSGGRYIRLLSGSTFAEETPGSWATGVSEGVVIQTPWLNPGALQGYKRIRRATFLGRYFTGALRVEVHYDYRTDSPAEVHEWRYDELVAVLHRSDIYEAGESVPAYRLQLAIRPDRQKCEAIRFTITEITTPPGQGEDTGLTGTPGRGLELVAIALDVATKRGAIQNVATGAKH
jgi:hypothetical protein